MNYLLAPVGSAGDVYPYLGLAQSLGQRGHHVTMLTSGYFQEATERLGISFVEVATAESFLKVVGDPKVWHRFHGPRAVCRYATNLIAPLYETIHRLGDPATTVLVSSSLGWGARLAQERDNFSLVTLALQPAIFWSDIRPPRLPGMLRSRWIPQIVKRWQYDIGERFVLDPACCPQLNAFRRRLGLAPIRGITRWWNSPERIVGLFPSWFAEPLPDWPSQVRQTEFPLWDEDPHGQLPPDLEEFLDGDSPPLVITPGSANRFGVRFFETCITACRRLGFRAVLVTRFREQLPGSLPDGMRHVPYVSFARLLPRAAGIVHHGGIGTTARALASGIPQVIHPLSHDQPDNGDRVTLLGVGMSLEGRGFTVPRLTSVLGRLRDDPTLSSQCGAVARRMATTNPFTATCEEVTSVREKGIGGGCLV